MIQIKAPVSVALVRYFVKAMEKVTNALVLLPHVAVNTGMGGKQPALKALFPFMQKANQRGRDTAVFGR